MTLEQIIEEIEGKGYTWEIGVSERSGFGMTHGTKKKNYWMEIFAYSRVELRANNEESPIAAAETILRKLND